MPSQDNASLNCHSKQYGNLRAPPHYLVYKQSVEDYFFDRSPSVSKRSVAGPISFSAVQRAKSTGSSISLRLNRSTNPQVHIKNQESPESRNSEPLSKREFPMQFHCLPLTVASLSKDSMAKRRTNWQRQPRESVLCLKCGHW